MPVPTGISRDQADAEWHGHQLQKLWDLMATICCHSRSQPGPSLFPMPCQGTFGKVSIYFWFVQLQAVGTVDLPGLSPGMLLSFYIAQETLHNKEFSGPQCQ